MDYSSQRINQARIDKMQKSSAKKTKNKIIVIIMRVAVIAIFTGATWVGSMLFGAYFSIIDRAEPISEVHQSMVSDDNYNTIIYDHYSGQEIDRLQSSDNREYVESWSIPLHMKLAIVANEDRRFFEHDGVDLYGSVRAIWVNLVENRTEGASTITQQVIKMKRGYRHNTFDTKLQEQVMALKLEQALTADLGSKEAAKDYILNIYLNSVALGHGATGVQAASLRYFNKDVKDITLSEAVTIACVTSNPTKYSPIRMTTRNSERRLVVLNNMLELGFITKDEYDEALADNVYERVANNELTRDTGARSYFVDQLIREVRADLMEKYGYSAVEATEMIFSKGLSIYATVNNQIQAIVDAAYLNESLFPKTEYEVEIHYEADIRNTTTNIVSHYTNSKSRGVVKSLDAVDAYVESLRDKALREGDEIVPGSEQIIPVVQPQSGFAVVDITNGHVVAIAGVRGEKTISMNLNRAVSIERAPGSTFKTFTYAAGLDLGEITAASVLDDTPRYNVLTDGTLEEWPKNWYGKGVYRGLFSMRQGVAQSLNVITVKLLEKVGVDEVIKYIENFGIELKAADRALAPIALGGLTTGVAPLDMAAAYAAIANGGMYNEPVFYTKVLDHNGAVLLENTPNPQQVLRRETAFILTDLLAEAMRTGTGQAARLNGVTMPTGGKTGTTTETKDLWFSGFSPYYAGAVWIGYDKQKPLAKSTTDDRTHLKLWSYIMTEIHKNLPAKDFQTPGGIERETICNMSGLLPVPGLCDHDYRGGRDHRGIDIIRSEYFEIGTTPREYCDVHARFEICVGIQGESGWALPGQYCPSDHVTTVVGIIRREPYSGDRQIPDAWVEKPTHICTVHTQYGNLAQPQVVSPDQQSVPNQDPNVYLNQPTQTPPIYADDPDAAWQEFFNRGNTN